MTTKNLSAFGAGGKKSGGEEAPDTLRATSFAKIMLLLGEGVMNGPPGGNLLRNIYLDETPVESATGELNFEGVKAWFRPGTVDQDPLPGFNFISSEVNVGVEIKQDSPIVRNVSDTAADYVKIRFVVPSLQKIDQKKGIQENSVRLQIDITNNGVYETRIDDTLQGKSSSNYPFEYQIQLRGSSPWSIRVRRISKDADNENQNQLYWQNITVQAAEKLRYPNSALLGLRFAAEKFSSVPAISINMRGTEIKVPHNYDPETRVYTGIFNGSLKTAWSNNPAWIFYDMLTNPRYGAGRYITAGQVDLTSLYTIGQYCDQLVPDGKGGTEPRFRCNVYLRDSSDAYNVLGNLASAFRGMIYWAEGRIFATQDAPSTPTRLYTEANTIQEVDEQGNIVKPCFEYSGSDSSARNTAILVSWFDPTDRYREKIEYVEDADGIALYGYKEQKVTAIGTTSQGQARRFGEWILYTEKLETDVVSFSVGSDGMLCRPGEIVRIADPGRAGKRIGGRIVSATSSTVTLDSPLELLDEDCSLRLIDPSTGLQRGFAVANPPGTYTVISVPSLDFLPEPGQVWMLTSTSLKSQLARVIFVDEADGVYNISALLHNPSKYNFVDFDKPLQEQRISVISSPLSRPAPPGYLKVTEELYTNQERIAVKVKAVLTWSPPESPYVSQYRISYRLKGDQFYKASGSTVSTSFEILDISPGIYDFRVQAINSFGVTGLPIIVRQNILGLKKIPEDISGFAGRIEKDKLTLTWNLHPDLDVQVGGLIRIRYTQSASVPEAVASDLAAIWTDGFVVAELEGKATSFTLPNRSGVYSIKAIDSSGNPSNRASTLTAFLPSLEDNTVLSTEIDYGPNFAFRSYFDEPGFGVGAIGYKAVTADGIVKLNSIRYVGAIKGPVSAIQGEIGSMQPRVAYLPGRVDYLQGNVENLLETYNVFPWAYYEPPIKSLLTGNPNGFQSTQIVVGDTSYYPLCDYLVELDTGSYSVTEAPQIGSYAGLMSDFPGKLDTAQDVEPKVTIVDASNVLTGISLFSGFIDPATYDGYRKVQNRVEALANYRLLLRIDAIANFLNTHIPRLKVKFTPRPREVITGTITFTNSTSITFPHFLKTPDVAATLINPQSGDRLTVTPFQDHVDLVLSASSPNPTRTVTYTIRGYGKFVSFFGQQLGAS